MYKDLTGPPFPKTPHIDALFCCIVTNALTQCHQNIASLNLYLAVIMHILCRFVFISESISMHPSKDHQNKNRPTRLILRYNYVSSYKRLHLQCMGQPNLFCSYHKYLYPKCITESHSGTDKFDNPIPKIRYSQFIETIVILRIFNILAA